MEKYPGLTVSYHGVHVLVVLGLVAFDEDGRHVLIAGDDADRADGGGSHAGRGCHACLHIVGEAADALRLVAGQRRIDGEAEQMLAAESQIDVLQIVQRPRKQRGGDQHQQRERHLRDHQCLAQADVRAAGGDVTGVVLQGERELRRSGLPGGSQSEEDAGENGEPEGEGEHAQVRSGGERKVRGIGKQTEEGAAGPPGEENSDGAAGDRENEAFGNQLAHQQEAAGAHGKADRDLFLPADGAGEQQVGDIGAGDQQQQADDAEQDQQRIGKLRRAGRKRPCRPGRRSAVWWQNALRLRSERNFMVCISMMRRP